MKHSMVKIAKMVKSNTVQDVLDLFTCELHDGSSIALSRINLYCMISAVQNDQSVVH